MWNPLILSRDPIATALPPERAAAAIDQALAHGVRGDGWHRGVYGNRKGNSFEFAITQLRLSEALVARGRIAPESFGSSVRYTVGPPLFGIVMFQVFCGLAALGSLYQVYMQLFGPEVPMGGRLAGLRDTLGGIGFFGIVLALLLLVGRWRMASQASSLEIVMRVALKPVLESTTPSKRPIE